MRVTAYLRRPRHPDADTSMNPRLLGLANSFDGQHDVNILYKDDVVDDKSDLIIHWGYQPRSRQLLDARERRIPVLVVDCGYFGNRRDNYSIGYNGLNGTAFRPVPGEAPRPHPELLPWVQRDPVRALVCGQLAGDASLQIDGIHSLDEWCIEKARHLTSVGYTATVRPHPFQPSIEVPPPFHEIVRDYDLVATWSSNAGVEALFNGVPATAESNVSMIADTSVRQVDFDDSARKRWAHWISYAQFTPDEFADGTAAKHMMTGYDEARAGAEKEEYA